MKSSGDTSIDISDCSSDWSSLPDLTEPTDSQNDLLLSRFQQPNSCTVSKLSPDLVIEIDDDSNSENDIIVEEDINTDINNSSYSSQRNYKDDKDYVAEKSDVEEIFEINVPRYKKEKKSSFVPYLFQSPSTGMIRYGQSLQLQSALSMELIYSYIEEGTAFANYTAYITDVLYSCKPDVSIVEKLFKLLMSINCDSSCRTDEFISLSYFEIYRLLNVICHRYPETIRIIWSQFSEIAMKKSVPLINLSLVVELSLSVFESELNEIVSSNLNETKKYQVYKILANEEAYSSVKYIITMLKYCFDILQVENSDVFEILIHKLQKLLDISVYISSKSISMADRIAKDLVSFYNEISYLKYRMKLINSIKSELIRFKLIENILVLHYDNIALKWNDIPSSFSILAECFFEALPRKCHLLATNNSKTFSHYHEQSCEELTMLLYYIVNSYILYLQHSEINLSSSINQTPESSLQDYLRGVFRYVERLKMHMKELNSKFTENTTLYLMIMDHLTDLHNEDVILSAF